MKHINSILKPALFLMALVGFFATANGAWATNSAANVMGTGTVSADTTGLAGSNTAAGANVLQQVYNLIRFAYIFFYAVAVLIIAQAWMQFKQQKYEVMFASLGAALGLFLTPALVDFLHGLGAATATTAS
jgi:hypothetical protein